MTKKIFLAILCLALSVLAYAQQHALSDYKPKKGSVLAEGIISNIIATGPIFDDYGLKFRYFLKDDVAARIQIGNYRGNQVTYVYQNQNVPDPKNGTATVTNPQYSILLGLEKHLIGTDRLSVYTAADMGYIYNLYKLDLENIDPMTGNYSANNFSTVAEKYNQIVAALGTGADYYIVKKLYLGAEVGLKMTLTTGNTAISSTNPNTGEVTEINRKAYKLNELTTRFTPIHGFRIGYIF